MNTDALTMILKHLVGYITQVFKPCTLQGSWPTAKDLPLYLQGGWAYQIVELDGQRCLLMLDEHEQPDTAQRLKKNLNKISKYFEGPVIYGVAELASYNRKRLIDQGIAFVVPGNQLYLPFMALDLRENFAAEIKSKNVTFVIEPYLRFEGLSGEQMTMFFYDPCGNALEFKAFKDMSQLFAS